MHQLPYPLSNRRAGAARRYPDLQVLAMRPCVQRRSGARRKCARPALVRESRERAAAPRTIRPARPLRAPLKSPVESRVAGSAEPRSAPSRAGRPRREPAGTHRTSPSTAEAGDPSVPPRRSSATSSDEPEADDPLNRTFGDRDQKADTGENLRFDFSDERDEPIGDVAGRAPIEFEPATTADGRSAMRPTDFAPRRLPSSASLLAD